MKIAIVGCGNIGKIYARTFVKYNLVQKNDLFLVEKTERLLAELSKEGFSNILSNNLTELDQCDLILIAVKPQDFESIATDISKIISSKQVILSIMAGVTIKRLQQSLKSKFIVRAMPNSPIQLGLGMTAFCASAEVDAKKLRIIEQLLSSTGRTIFFEDEKRMDAVTALSGSGPAYLFFYIKTMIEAGQEMGLNQAEATMLVNQTVLGAFHMMNSSNHNLDELIKIVASKGGTTEAALAVFKEGKLEECLKKGVLAAEQRGKELANA